MPVFNWNGYTYQHPVYADDGTMISPGQWTALPNSYTGGVKPLVSILDSSGQHPYANPIPTNKGAPKLELRSTVLNNSVLTVDQFILLGSDEQVAEKIQIIETFGPAFLFVLGKKPRIFSYTLALLNDPNNNWRDKLLSFWDRGLSASQAVAASKQAVLTYDGTTRVGQLIALDAKTVGETQIYTIANIQMFITRTFPVVGGDNVARPAIAP